MKQYVLVGCLMILSFMAGLCAGFFIELSEKDSSAQVYYEVGPLVSTIENLENEDFISELEKFPLKEWEIYTDGAHKDTIYVIDYSFSADFTTIYSDGKIYAGKYLISLNKTHEMRVKKLYSKIKKSNGG